jgi:hypothetical protein
MRKCSRNHTLDSSDPRKCHPNSPIKVAVSSPTLGGENASLYAEAGVKEYWIVLGPEQRVEGENDFAGMRRRSPELQ